MAYISAQNADNAIISLRFIFASKTINLNNSTGVVEYEWIPNSNLLAIVTRHQNRKRVFLVDLLDNLETSVDDDGYFNALSVSPDGSKFAYVVNNSGSCSVRIYYLNEQSVFKLDKNIICAASPSWSPDGNNLTFVSSENRNQLLIYSINDDAFINIQMPFDPVINNLTWYEDDHILGITNGEIVVLDIKSGLGQGDGWWKGCQR